MRLHKNLLLLLLMLLATACEYLPKLDEVVPDRRTEYKKSEAMPDLEVPPDLTVSNETDPLSIPNEEATTLSQFENQKKMRHGGAGATAGAGAKGDEQWLTVQGETADIWPKLKEFWKAKGYTLDLDDQELGVLETNWLETKDEGAADSRNKYSIFTEAGTTPGSTVLYLDSQSQVKVVDKDGKADWVDSVINVDAEKQIIGELNLHFYGKQTPASSPTVAKSKETPVAGESAAVTATGGEVTPAAGKPATVTNNGQNVKAEILNLDEDKVYLSLPEEFNRAWGLTEAAILDAGMFIDNKDRTKGLYYVNYSGQEGEQKKKGLLSKLKFWGDKKEEARKYQISLTGVGEKTELVVLDEKGEWVSQEEAKLILTLLQGQYNSTHSTP